MKKHLLFTIPVILGFMFVSCNNDDDGYAKFAQSTYTIHYDESVDLKLTSSEKTSLFRYFLNASNVAEVSSEGIVKGLYVGEVTVVAKYNDLSAQCNVVVQPYENLYRMIPLVTGGIDRNTVKFLENAISRDTLPGAMDVLIIAPDAEDLALETLQYSFGANGLVSVDAFLKGGTEVSKINRFLTERYPYKQGYGYEDTGTGAKVNYVVADNKIEYTW